MIVTKTLYLVIYEIDRYLEKNLTFNFSATIAAVTELNNPYELKHVREVKEFIFNDISKKLNIKIPQNGKSNFPDLEMVHKIVNHPVHIKDSSGGMSPSAFIPFCHFGKWLGEKIVQFDVPVCNIFEEKILNDQLCYKVDPNKFRYNLSTNEFLHGLTFYVDINQDRQTLSGESTFKIHMDTLGTNDEIKI